jgi:Mn2+/Fe2+ NRAMP family transporter
VAYIRTKNLSILGGILALLAAFLREVPLAILAGGTVPAGSEGFYSLAMFATPEFEVFAWGTIAGGTATLLADFSIEGLFGLATWGFLVIAAVLAFSGASPHATPQNGKVQRALAALFLLADAGLFLVLALLSSTLGIAGLRLGWFCVVIGGVLVAISTRDKASDAA